MVGFRVDGHIYVSVTGRLYKYRRIHIIRPWAMHLCYVYFTTYARNWAKSALKREVGMYYIMGV